MARNDKDHEWGMRGKSQRDAKKGKVMMTSETETDVEEEAEGTG